VGDYSYVAIAERYRAHRPDGLVLGLTASPGAKRQRVDEVVRNLGIAAVESRTAEDEDARDHVKDIDVEWERVALPPELRQAQKLLGAVLRERVRKLQRGGVLVHKKAEHVSKGDVLQAGDLIRKRLARRRAGYLFAAMSNVGVAIQAYHTLELLETQGVEPFRSYLEKLELKEKPGKSDRVFLKDPRVQAAREAVQRVAVSHPKLSRLVEVLRAELDERPDALCIVFAQYRDTIDSILRVLEKEGIAAERFVGQATRGADKGMSQAAQAEALQRFQQGAFRVLVASSVAEEGLHIPQVDLVVFYEPVVSEIRAIQRRGRTGRGRDGRVVVLVARKTRDEAYAHAERRREDKMRALVRGMGDEALEQPEFAVDPEEPA
jgi:Fanconi anemia group M protein